MIDQLNLEQSQAVVETSHHLLVIAGPGTGKTRVITHKIVHLIQAENVDQTKILVLTFTKKADC